MVTTTRHSKHAVYNGQGAGCQNCRDNATTENSLLGAKRHMGRMGAKVLVQQIQMDCATVQVFAQRSDANGPHGSKSASRRVPLSRQHQRDVSGKRDLTAANRKPQKRRAHDEPLRCTIGQITRRPGVRLFGNLLSARGNWALDPETRRPNPD